MYALMTAHVILWHKSYKMNNNLGLYLGITHRESAKHAGIIKKSTSLRTSARSFTLPSPCPQVSAFDQPLPLSFDVLSGRPLPGFLLCISLYTINALKENRNHKLMLENMR